MRSGDTVRDGQGNAYQVGQLLGRGLWGRCFVARRELTDQLFVLKVPLAPDDIRGEGGAPESFFLACRDALMEEARLYEQGQVPFLPRLEARFTGPDGQPAMLLPRLAESLESRIQEGLGVGPLVEAILVVAKLVRQLAGGGVAGATVHGGLRTTNILYSDSGELFLTDVATPATRRNITAFVNQAPQGHAWLPPEVVGGGAGGDGTWSPAVDTWALSMILWRGIVGPEVPISWPTRGLDKASAGAVKDKLIQRMKAEDSNPRFHGRLAERVGVLLSRALSLEVAPSPPYRFSRLDEFVLRLEEVAALIRPQVTSVGKVLHDRPAARPFFATDEAVSFSVTVGVTAGVEGREEIGVGIAVFDLARDSRVKDLDLGYTVEKHPSGRYRFAFRINGMGPGPYRARVAFAIRDSGQPPATAESEFEIRAAPGWVPPADAPLAAPPLAFAREQTGVTSPRLEPPSAADTPVGVIHTRTAVLPAAGDPPAAAEAVPTAARDREPARQKGSEVGAPEPLCEIPLPRGNVAPPPIDAEPTPVARPRPLLPESAPPLLPIHAPERVRAAVPAAIASPLPPTPAAMGGPGALDEPAFEPPRSWTYEPIPRGKQAAVANDDPPSQVDGAGEDDGEPSPIGKFFTSVKNDPFVLVMSSLAGLILILLVLFLALRS
ncbi:MAG: hypothetical protein EXR71_14225 [Myxococcales bacterium]|nr:hypothetical protein [Myxococcales bacterium]